MTKEQDQAQIAALLAERRGYVMRGLEMRVRQVDAELARLGHGGAPPAKRATKRVRKPKETR